MRGPSPASTQVDVPSTIKEVVGEAKEGEFLGSLDELASQAFDDQCTGANPRYPLISDLKQVCVTREDRIAPLF
jgi:acetaldehyde dehydrogenase/alcohol dehydrogenase